MNAKDLIEKRAKAWADAKAFLDTNSKDGVMSAENVATYEKMEAEIQTLSDNIKIAERAQNLEAALKSPTSSPIVDPVSANTGKGFRASDEYKQAFVDMLRTRKVSNALEAGTDSEGGYLVPDEFDTQLVQALTEENVMRQLCRIITTGSDHKIPVVTSQGAAAWTDEEGDYNDSDDAFNQISLSAHKATRIIKVSEELLNDSYFNLEQYLAESFGESFGALEEAAFIGGDGDGKPTGILDATNGAATGLTTASATAITADEILDLYYALKDGYRKNGTWLMNESTVKAIRKLKDGNGQYLWQPSMLLGTPDMLLGRPVRTSSAVEAIAASERVMAFGDFQYYWIADRTNRTFKRLNELYAAKGQVGFCANQRVDGKLTLTEAVKCMITHA